MNLAGTRNFRQGRALARICAFGAAPLALGLSLAAAAPKSPAGLWFTANQRSVVRIAPCGEDFCGVVTWMKEPNGPDGKPKIDRLNEDPAKRGKPVLGLEILQNLAVADDHWRGKAYNPEDGKTYDITFKVISDDSGERAELEGCVLKILCKTEVFTRAQSVPKSAPPSP